MSEVNLVALRDHPFGTGTRAKGEAYVATKSEAEVLVALGWAAEEGKAEKKVEKVITTEESTKSGKGTYRTRDLKAKG